MQSITDNPNRNGNFTSSEIVRLIGNGKRPMTPAELAARPKTGTGSATKQIEDPAILSDTALEYIAEKNMERRLTRTLSTESNARPLTWGKALELRCFELLGLEYILCSDTTLDHPDIPYWKGSPDGMKYDADKTVVEQKCPITLKSFCQLVDPLYEGKTGMDAINAIRNGWTDKNGMKHSAHKDGEKYYWQMVSNACITGAKFAELIVYVPYFDELEAVRELVRNTDEGIQSQFAWINFADDRELPYLIEGAYYRNLNVIRFEVPVQDKALLRVKVEIAGKLLTKIA